MEKLHPLHFQIIILENSTNSRERMEGTKMVAKHLGLGDKNGMHTNNLTSDGFGERQVTPCHVSPFSKNPIARVILD